MEELWLGNTCSDDSGLVHSKNKFDSSKLSFHSLDLKISYNISADRVVERLIAVNFDGEWFIVSNVLERTKCARNTVELIVVDDLRNLKLNHETIFQTCTHL